MPHIIVKIAVGRSDENKHLIATALTKAIMHSAQVPDEALSVSIEDFDPAEWGAKVFKPDIIDKPDLLYKKPGYTPA
ncbi:tautomerase family protein [Acidisoma cellulosilytica]|uniref:Tautomerase family protein n=1 Tax=Acidisoma cellulosilyticum TaxID=2802395 RepID=A0A963Z601_9PROT|nr:tautomerase family protein [Acidisoma cellulosilyticum]MCB8883194.1 tautomerase family protein [Acidisoma cellulosilyticum]